MAVSPIPLSLKTSASVPTAVFCVPLVLSKSAAAPTAVLESALLRTSAPPPTAVLKFPVVSEKSDRQPSAVFPLPVVRTLSASHPSAVVKLGKHPSGAGLTACAPGKSAQHANTGRMVISILLRFFMISLCCLFVVLDVREFSLQRTVLRFVHNRFGRRFTHVELGARFLNLRGLLSKLGRERLYLLLLLRDRCLQVLHSQI